MKLLPWEPRRHPARPAVSLPDRLIKRASLKCLYLFDRRDQGRTTFIPNRRPPEALYPLNLVGSKADLWLREWLGYCGNYVASPISWAQIEGLSMAGWEDFTIAMVARGVGPCFCNREPLTTATLCNVELRSASVPTPYAISTWNTSAAQQTVTAAAGSGSGAEWHAVVSDFGKRGLRLWVDGRPQGTPLGNYALQGGAQQLYALGKRGSSVIGTVCAFLAIWREQLGDSVSQAIMHSLPSAMRSA